MYNYSPVKGLYVKNFRNIGEVSIDFTDSPIVSLIGENEAGKTSIVKAFSVCALHATPRDQKDYIRDGTDGFGVAIELEDGTIITRIKRSNLNWYSVKNADGSEWNTNKIESGLPIQVSKVMGLIEEPETKEFLQIRTYEDQLLFVVTPASTNYKVMYDALKVDQLTRAIKAGSKEVNELRSEINENETGIATLTANLRKLRTFDIEPLLNIKHRLASELSAIEKLEHACSVLDTIEAKRKQLGALTDIAENNIQEINEAEATRISNIARLLNTMYEVANTVNIVSQIERCDEIDLEIYNKICGMVSKLDTIKSSKSRLGALVELVNASPIDEVEADHLLRAKSSLASIERAKSSLSAIDTSDARLIEQHDFDIVMKMQNVISLIDRKSSLEQNYIACNTYCKQMTEYLKTTGAAVEICPNCGESVVVDIEVYTKGG